MLYLQNALQEPVLSGLGVFSCSFMRLYEEIIFYGENRHMVDGLNVSECV